LRRIFILISFLFPGSILYQVNAQTDSSTHVNHQARYSFDGNGKNDFSDSGSRDLIDVWNTITKKKVDTTAQELHPAKYHYSIIPGIGYTLSTGFAVIVATNVAFYTNDPDKTNVSNILMPVVYSQYNQLTIPIIANIWTKDNKYNIVSDWRYYKYPQDTYGLGGHSSLDNENDIDYSHLRIHQSVLRKIFPNVYAGPGYFLDYHWDVKEEGLSDGSESDAAKYGLPPKSVSSGPVVNLLYDNRKNAINPSNGLYANVLYRPNFTWMGSDENWQSLTIDVRKYVRLPGPWRHILAFWSFDWLTLSGKPPYLDLPSTGWDNYNNTGRGYIQGRFRSNNMLYLEAEYRFDIMRNGLIGGVLFANAQSFSNYPVNNFDMIWPGLGLGIRLKANKRSNTNIAIDYGFGMDGSRGFFVNLGEVF